MSTKFFLEPPKELIFWTFVPRNMCQIFVPENELELLLMPLNLPALCSTAVDRQEGVGVPASPPIRQAAAAGGGGSKKGMDQYWHSAQKEQVPDSANTNNLFDLGGGAHKLIFPFSHTRRDTICISFYLSIALFSREKTLICSISSSLYLFCSFFLPLSSYSFNHWLS